LRDYRCRSRRSEPLHRAIKASDHFLQTASLRVVLVPWSKRLPSSSALFVAAFRLYDECYLLCALSSSTRVNGLDLFHFLRIDPVHAGPTIARFSRGVLCHCERKTVDSSQKGIYEQAAMSTTATTPPITSGASVSIPPARVGFSMRAASTNRCHENSGPDDFHCYQILPEAPLRPGATRCNMRFEDGVASRRRQIFGGTTHCACRRIAFSREMHTIDPETGGTGGRRLTKHIRCRKWRRIRCETDGRPSSRTLPADAWAVWFGLRDAMSDVSRFERSCWLWG